MKLSNHQFSAAWDYICLAKTFIYVVNRVVTWGIHSLEHDSIHLPPNTDNENNNIQSYSSVEFWL